MNKPKNITNFLLLKVRTGVAYFLITKVICKVFQVSLVANYVKELNMVQLEIVPKSIERDRKQGMMIPDEALEGVGDPIPPTA